MKPELINGVPCVKAKVVFIDMGDMKTGDYESSQVFTITGHHTGTWYKVVLISESESMHKGDLMLNGRVIVQCMTEGAFQPHNFLKKVLADSKNLSERLLDEIRAGKYQNGSNIYLECTSTSTTPLLDAQGQVIVHRRQDPSGPEKIFTRAEVEALCAQSMAQGMYNVHFPEKAVDIDKWIQTKLT